MISSVEDLVSRMRWKIFFYKKKLKQKNKNVNSPFPLNDSFENIEGHDNSWSLCEEKKRNEFYVLGKLFNKNCLKISYQCMPNKRSKIGAHNKTMLLKKIKKVITSKACKCKKNVFAPSMASVW